MLLFYTFCKRFLLFGALGCRYRCRSTSTYYDMVANGTRYSTVYQYGRANVGKNVKTPVSACIILLAKFRHFKFEVVAELLKDPLPVQDMIRCSLTPNDRSSLLVAYTNSKKCPIHSTIPSH